MLRLLVIALLAANVAYFSWSMGWLDSVVGIRAAGDREPERMARQVNPERVSLAAASLSDNTKTRADQAASSPLAAASGPAVALASASAPAPAPAPASASASALASASAAPRPPPDGSTRIAAAASAASSPQRGGSCLEAGPFVTTELASAEKLIQSTWPDGKWTRRPAGGSGEWMIYMGPYPDDAWLERKKGELSRIRGGLPFEVLSAPAQLDRGISLGRFASQGAAEQRLDQLRQRGIRTAKVVRSGNGADLTMLRIAQADANAADRLAAIKWPSGKSGFTPCPTPP